MESQSAASPAPAKPSRLVPHDLFVPIGLSASFGTRHHTGWPPAPIQRFLPELRGITLRQLAVRLRLYRVDGLAWQAPDARDCDAVRLYDMCT